MHRRVLDEFALILHLDDVYWSEQGRVSVDAVLLVLGVLVLLLLGFRPGDVELEVNGQDVGWVLIVQLVVTAVAVVVALLKGKLATGTVDVR